jgi:hypothetical protein
MGMIMAVLMLVVTNVTVFPPAGVHVALSDDVLGLFVPLTVSMVVGMTINMLGSFMLVVMTTIVLVIGIAGLAYGNPQGDPTNNCEGEQNNAADQDRDMELLR